MPERVTQAQIDAAVESLKTEDFSMHPWCRNCVFWDCHDGRRITSGLTSWTIRASGQGDCLNRRSVYFIDEHGYCTRSWMGCGHFTRRG